MAKREIFVSGDAICFFAIFAFLLQSDAPIFESQNENIQSETLFVTERAQKLHTSVRSCLCNLMPSGKTHDAITFLLAPPTFLLAWRLTNDSTFAAFTTGAFLFGGLMFGPDLDTQSVQYTRWGVFRFLWFPYKVVFAHRSRWSHGLIFGTLFRVVYFCGAVTLFGAAVLYLAAMARNAAPPSLNQIQELWETAGVWTRLNFGYFALAAIFVGLWLGAASHTVTDLIGTFLKTGRVKDFL